MHWATFFVDLRDGLCIDLCINHADTVDQRVHDGSVTVHRLGMKEKSCG